MVYLVYPPSLIPIWCFYQKIEISQDAFGNNTDKGPPDAIKEKYKEAQIPLKEHSNTLPSIGTVLNHFRYRRKCSIALKIHSVAPQVKLI